MYCLPCYWLNSRSRVTGMNCHWFMKWVQNWIQWLRFTLAKKIYTSFLESYDLFHTRENKHIWLSEFQVLLWFLVHIASYLSSLSAEALSELWISSQGIGKNINSCRIPLLYVGFFSFKRNMESTKISLKIFIHNISDVEFIFVFLLWLHWNKMLVLFGKKFPLSLMCFLILKTLLGDIHIALYHTMYNCDNDIHKQQIWNNNV